MPKRCDAEHLESEGLLECGSAKRCEPIRRRRERKEGFGGVDAVDARSGELSTGGGWRGFTALERPGGGV